MELYGHGIAGLELGVLGQDVAFRVEQVVARLTCGDDLIRCHTVLFNPDDMTAGGQAGEGDGAGLGIDAHTFACKAGEGHGLSDRGTGNRHGAAGFRREGVARACGAEIEQNVMLSVQCKLFVGKRSGRAGAVDLHVGRNR